MRPDLKPNTRFALMLAIILAAAGVRILTAPGGERPGPARLPLALLPASIDSWSQAAEGSLTPGEARELGADDYLSRSYTGRDGLTANLFIAYYANQRHRRTIHSPQNCLPGSGWAIGEHRVHHLAAGGSVNEYAIEKDGAGMLAFYWYQGRGRIEDGDLTARLHTIKDALTSGRTDGAVVRLVIPSGPDDAGREHARSAALSLIASLLGRLDDYIPR